MKPKYFIIVSLILILIAGCATVPKCPACPPERAYFRGDGGGLVYFEKGWFDKKEGRWLTQEEVDKRFEEYKKERERRGGF